MQLDRLRSGVALRRAASIAVLDIREGAIRRAAGLLLLTISVIGAAADGRADELTETLELFQTGKYASCCEAAAGAMKQPALADRARMLKIRAEVELGRYEDAAATVIEGIKARPFDLELRWIARDVYRLNGIPEQVAPLDAEIIRLIEQSPLRYPDPASRLVIARFLLEQGADPKRVLQGIIAEVQKRHPDLAVAWIAQGDVALSKGDFALAAEAFAEAVKHDSRDPDAHFGLAQAFAPSEASKAEESLKATLTRNPNHLRALLMVVDGAIDSERYDAADETLSRVAAVNPKHPLASAYRAVLAHLRGDSAMEEEFRSKALGLWKENPEVDHLIGKKLSQKYRFAEGSEYQRRALKSSPGFAPARIQLAQDLLRLGKEEEGWKLANEAFNTDGYNVVAHNLVELQGHLDKFKSLESDGIIARMDAREAEIYGGRVLELLQRARRELCAKYDVSLDQPVIVEIFPRQQDFAIRTFGLPGGAGFLGVCFGTVITANSPASQAASPSCWEATLWHEFCHVVTLSKTKNRMPRWLSEGISVFEERQADPAWGQSINPTYRKMLLADDLVPVSKLSGAFLHPSTPLHLQFAYFEASLVVEYFVATYGHKALKQVLSDLGNGLQINEAFARHAGSIEELDKKFAEFARARANSMAPGADWAEPELPAQADLAGIREWVAAHPHNYPGLQRLATRLVADKKWDEALVPLDEMRRLYPRDRRGSGHFPLRARIYRETDRNVDERRVLEEFAELSPDDVDVLDRLTELTARGGDWEMSRKYALRWLAVSPMQPEPHRRSMQAAEALGDWPLAIASGRALLAFDPIDAAGIHLQLATTLQRSGDLMSARRHALLALEETPRFRDAQKRLLEIAREIEQRETTDVRQKESSSASSPDMEVP